MRTLIKGYNYFTSLMPTMEHIQEILANDPVYNCEIYRKYGCSHVDGLLCDYPDCEMLKEHLSEL